MHLYKLYDILYLAIESEEMSHLTEFEETYTVRMFSYIEENGMLGGYYSNELEKL